MLRKEKKFNETLKLMCLLATWCSLAGESKSRKTDRIEYLGGAGEGSVGIVKALVILQGSLSFLTIRMRH